MWKSGNQQNGQDIILPIQQQQQQQQQQMKRPNTSQYEYNNRNSTNQSLSQQFSKEDLQRPTTSTPSLPRQPINGLQV
jgi:hypothetical protein